MVPPGADTRYFVHIVVSYSCPQTALRHSEITYCTLRYAAYVFCVASGVKRIVIVTSAYSVLLRVRTGRSVSFFCIRAHAHERVLPHGHADHGRPRTTSSTSCTHQDVIERHNEADKSYARAYSSIWTLSRAALRGIRFWHSRSRSFLILPRAL